MLPTIDWESKQKSDTRLTLTFRDSSVVVSDRKKSINIGRADDNDLVVKGNLISRIHAKVEMRRGKFMLIDQSTNGTFISGEGGNDVFVRRDDSELHGHGIIGLGKEAEKDVKRLKPEIFENPLIRNLDAVPVQGKIIFARRCAGFSIVVHGTEVPTNAGRTGMVHLDKWLTGILSNRSKGLPWPLIKPVYTAVPRFFEVLYQRPRVEMTIIKGRDFASNDSLNPVADL